MRTAPTAIVCVVTADDVVFEAADEVIDAEVMVLLEATAPTANAPTPTSMDGNHIVSCLVDLEALDEFPGRPTWNMRSVASREKGTRRRRQSSG